MLQTAAACSSLRFVRKCSSMTRAMVDIVSSCVGGLKEMEETLDRLVIEVTPSLVTDVISSSSKDSGSSSRRLLRFFSWCQRRSSEGLGDEVFNQAIRAFADMNDLVAIEIALSDFRKMGLKLDKETFARAAEVFVKLGRPERAVSLFRDVEEKQRLKLQQNNEVEECSSVTMVVHALCAKGYARKALGILYHHKDKVKSEDEFHHHRSLILHGWAVHGNAKEARRVLDEMKSLGNKPSLASYHDFLRCICKRNLKVNPSALVPEATNIMTEMRLLGISPTSVSFNILLSCLGKARRVKESCKIFFSMMQAGDEGTTPDAGSYFLVIRLLYLTGRFDRGNKLLNRMSEEEDKGRLMPRANSSFYHNLIGVLCGMEKVEHALRLLERMKRRCCFCQGEEHKLDSHNFGPTYDLLITKICRNGKFELGRHLWDEAVGQGITLQCSSNLLDPLKAPEVFKPTRKVSIEKTEAAKSSKSTILMPKKKKCVTRISQKRNRIKGKKGH